MVVKEFVFMFRDRAKQDLHERSQRLVRTGQPFKLVGVERSIHFLRGVASRASFCLPAFYHFLGAASAKQDTNALEDYAFCIARSHSEFSNLSILSLACRKIFDHDTKTDLTGANFSKASDSVLNEHAEFWAGNSPYGFDEALSALKFLRRFFAECSKTDSVLLKSDSQLQKRIGLLKQHADRAAAHLSLESYEINIVDLAHFTGAIVLVGEIIRRFDRPDLGSHYFKGIDSASYEAAKRVFPEIAKFQLFSGIEIERKAGFCWQYGEEVGVEKLLNEVHYAFGYGGRE